MRIMRSVFDPPSEEYYLEFCATPIITRLPLRNGRVRMIRRNSIGLVARGSLFDALEKVVHAIAQFPSDEPASASAMPIKFQSLIHAVMKQGARRAASRARRCQ